MFHILPSTLQLYLVRSSTAKTRTAMRHIRKIKSLTDQTTERTETSLMSVTVDAHEQRPSAEIESFITV